MSTWEENVRKVTPYTPGEQPNRTADDQTEHQRESLSARPRRG